MNAHTDYQTINGADGKPLFVVVPYDVFVRQFEDERALVPHAVVQLMVEHDITPAKAWRLHLKLTQAELAERVGMTQGAYAQLEASENLRKASRAKLAAALGITPAQLDC